MATEFPRLGLTMRVVEAEGYAERRDALAQDWERFMREALPECAWMAVPNAGPGAVDHVRRWGVNGLILTGGNDIGTAPERDRTEQALLEYAVAAGWPVLGICRGLQMLQQHFGGPLRRCPREAHVAVRHAMHWVGPSAADARPSTVNSYHEWSIRADELARALEPLALADGGWIEGAVGAGRRVMGLMWHPEREHGAGDAAVPLVRAFFGLATEPAR